MASLLPLVGLVVALQVPSPTASADLSAELARTAAAIKTREADALHAVSRRLDARSDLEAAAEFRRVAPEPPPGVATRFPPLPEVVEARSAPGADAPAWRAELAAIRARSAKDLLALVETAGKAEPPHLAKASTFLRAILERDPDQPEARRLLGFVPYEGGWARPFAVRQLESGNVAHPTYGWVPENWVRHLELGELPTPTVGGRKPAWVSIDEADQMRAEWRPPWMITTEHFEIQTNVPLAEAIEFSRRLEPFHRIFFALTADVVGDKLPLAHRLRSPKLTGEAVYKPHRILYFADRNEYLRRVRTVTRDDVSNSLGYYDPPKSGQGNRAPAYFFRDADGQLPVSATLYHEVSHQLLFETAGPNAYLRNEGDYWVFEGLGTYFETVEPQPDGSIEVGGLVGPRLVEAARSLRTGKMMRLSEFLRQDQRAFNREDRIYVNYQQAMALTVYLMQADQGAYREPFLDYVRDAYRGRLRRSSGRTLEDRLGVPLDELERRFKAFYTNPPSS